MSQDLPTSHPNSSAQVSNPQKGIVIQSTGRRCKVRAEMGQVIECTVRGKFRIQNLPTTNPVAVGDWVIFLQEPNEELALITEILPRKNYILRKAVAQAHKIHVLCANIDQAILVFTVAHPTTSYGFVDRFLLITTAYEIPTKIVINKTDLINTAKQQDRLEEVIAIYTGIGIEVIQLSAIDPHHRAIALALFEGKVSFLGGHSGVGKSTLINLIDQSLAIKTAAISSNTQKGKHTTTHAEMHPLSVGGYLIDSPGIKELGIATFNKEDVSHNFPEMFKRLDECRFHNCLHVTEPGCAVKAAVDTGEIAQSRYDSYLSILEEIDQADSY